MSNETKNKDVYKTAIESIDKHCFVSAGAGTGKTYVLTMRYLEVILKGGNPEDIVALTFTRKAAAEMRERIRDNLSKYMLAKETNSSKKTALRNAINSLHKSQISTFHSFFADMLKIFAVEVGLDANFQLIEPQEFKIYILKEIEKAVGILLDEKNSTLLSLFSKYSTKEISATLHNLFQTDGAKIRDGLKKLTTIPDAAKINTAQAFNELFNKIRSMIVIPPDMLDYHTLEQKVSALFQDEKFRDVIKSRLFFKHLFVDEYQDTNFMQRDIIYRLCGIDPANVKFPESRKLFIVGDAKQSIYRFRDAEVNVFSRTQKDFETAGNSIAEVLTIDTCRRTTKHLGEFFNSLFDNVFNSIANLELPEIKYDELDFPKTLLPKGPEPEKVGLWLYCKNSKDKTTAPDIQTKEAEWIATQIRGLVKDGYAFKDVCILRHSVNGAGMPQLRNALAAANIPFYVSGLRGLMDCQAIIDIIQWLNVLAHPDDDIAFAACAKQPCFGLTDKDFMRIQTASKEDFADSEKTSGTFINRLKYASFKSNNDINQKLLFFREKLTLFKNKAGTISVAKLVNMIIEECKMIESWAAIPDKAEARRSIGNIEAFLFKLKQSEWGDSRDIFLFSEALDEGAIFPEDSEEAQLCDEQDNVVRIMTIHQSKGLEFNVVFVSKIDKLGHESKAGDCVLSFKQNIPVVKLPLADNPFGDKKSNDKQDEDEAQAELKRSFYVALTRAKERLFISGFASVTQARSNTDAISYIKDKSGAHWLLKGLLPQKTSLPEGVWPTPDTEHGFVFCGYKETALIEATVSVPAKPVEYVNVPVAEKLNVLMPSVDEIPSAKPVKPLSVKTSDKLKRPDNIKENDLGTIVHAFFAEWDFNEESIKRYAEEISSIYAEADKSVTEYIESCAKAFLTVQWKDKKLASIFAENIDSGRLMREYPFCYQKDDNGKIYQVQGIIDVLLTMPNGSLQIFDYKTGKEHEEYANQMTAYCEAFSGEKIHSNPVLIYF